MSSEVDPLVHTNHQESPKMCDRRVRYWFLRMLLLTIIFSVLIGLLIQIWLYYQSLSDDLDSKNINMVGYVTFCKNQVVKGWNVRDCVIHTTNITCHVVSTDVLDILTLPAQNITHTFQQNTLQVNTKDDLSTTCFSWILLSLPI